MSQKQTNQAASSNKAALINAMLQAGIRDSKEQAMFLAQTDHESLGFSRMREGNYRTASNLLNVFGPRLQAQGITTEEQAQALINTGQEKVYDAIYGDRMGNNKQGDGYRYRGRGFIQLTGRNNYEEAGKALQLDLIQHPELAENPDNAARIAVWYWKKRKGLAEAGRAGDVKQATRIINGGQNGFTDRKNKYERYLSQGPIQAQSAQQSLPQGKTSPTKHATPPKTNHSLPPEPADQAPPAVKPKLAHATSAAKDGRDRVLAQRARFDGYKYRYGGNGQKDAKGVNRIDCSHLVNQALTGAGYAIPYQTTAEMGGSRHYEEVDPKDVKPGDIALWRGDKNHTGIVENYDAKAGKGDFFGAQSKKGASSAKLGKGSWWGQPQKFLRPKAEYLTTSPPAKHGNAATPPATGKPIATTKPAAQTADKAQKRAQAAQAAQAAPHHADTNQIQQLLHSEGTTRQYRLSNGTTETRSGGSRSWRDNNPGNLKFPFAGSEAATKKLKVSKAQALARAQKKYANVVDLDHNGYAIFTDKDAGRAAQAQLLFQNHAEHSVEQMLPGYAMDDHSGKANHQKYAAMIHKTAAGRGLELHGKKLKDMGPAERDALQDGMQRMEGFQAGKVAHGEAVAASAPAHSTARAATAKPTAKAAPASAAAHGKAAPPKPAKPAASKAKPAPGKTATGSATEQIGAQLSALIAQLNAALAPLTQPIQICVDVQNGNIVAAVNAANSQQQRRS